MEPLLRFSQQEPVISLQLSARNRQPLNKLLEGAEVLLVKSEEPKILYSMRSKSSTGMPRPNTSTAWFRRSCGG